MTTKTKGTNTAPKRRVQRLAPADLVPTAKACTTKDGEFAVQVTTGRQRETLTPMEAYERAKALTYAAAVIDRIAEKVARVNDEVDAEQADGVFVPGLTASDDD